MQKRVEPYPNFTLCGGHSGSWRLFHLCSGWLTYILVLLVLVHTVLYRDSQEHLLSVSMYTPHLSSSHLGTNFYCEGRFSTTSVLWKYEKISPENKTLFYSVLFHTDVECCSDLFSQSSLCDAALSKRSWALPCWTLGYTSFSLSVPTQFAGKALWAVFSSASVTGAVACRTLPLHAVSIISIWTCFNTGSVCRDNSAK